MRTQVMAVLMVPVVLAAMVPAAADVAAYNGDVAISFVGHSDGVVDTLRVGHIRTDDAYPYQCLWHELLNGESLTGTVAGGVLSLDLEGSPLLTADLVPTYTFPDTQWFDVYPTGGAWHDQDLGNGELESGFGHIGRRPDPYTPDPGDWLLDGSWYAALTWASDGPAQRIPEPATMALLAAGVLPAVLRRRTGRS